MMATMTLQVDVTPEMIDAALREILADHWDSNADMWLIPIPGVEYGFIRISEAGKYGFHWSAPGAFRREKTLFEAARAATEWVDAEHA